MTTFEKIYIGKGRQVENLDIVKVSLKLEDLAQYAYEKEGVKYVTFEVARMKAADNFGRTHTVYFSQRVEKPEPKKARKPKKNEKPTEDLPF
jgi:hypothetical protein